MYIPRWALETDGEGNFVNQAPAVIVCAGFTNSRTFLDNVAIELSRAGFVVMNIDQYGHHKSETTHIRGYGVEPFSGERYIPNWNNRCACIPAHLGLC